ncbi:MAG TPA: phosphatase PAP2 family protein [Polyangiaceae bacterium]|jgi:hypothetical protein
MTPTEVDPVSGSGGRFEDTGPRRLWRELGIQDWLVGTYLLGLNVAAVVAPPSPLRVVCLQQVFALLMYLVATLVLVRSRLIKNDFVAAVLYRLAIYGTVQFSYFLFVHFLPVVNPRTLDQELYHLDLKLFGFEPAIWMDQFVTPATTTWFSFFYFGFFFLLGAHVIPILLFTRNRQLLSEFTMGMLIIFCVGHTLYMFVPGYGPYRAMAHEFHHQLPRGLWLDMIRATVATSGAQKDIFPSMHTAGPVFIALYSLRHRKRLPYRYTWPIACFFTANMMVATLFLRWHYVIDVIAGLFLAGAGLPLCVWLTRLELSRRAELDLAPSWPEFFPENGSSKTRISSDLAAA